ncbi:putative PfkB family kinase [Karstenula rhodostoma CBS 690.94]|uniref:PfkB family kinase n=1 Tax=Karstenula rhodostoma CBS 690.94 TaxID=1392251 RepID=A0A9P4PUX6_9PLEO|nr:putative PfkB family kinase [Karstenula rhodostoma CBS 690.94]
MSSPYISCVSLGMFVIDDIHMPKRSPLRDILGGSATFATLGLRLFTQDSKRIGCLLIAGEDFPSSVRGTIEEEWGTTTVVKVREGRKSTRGKLVYADETFGPKTFTYIHPPLKPNPSDLTHSPLLHARAFHLLATPAEILAHVPELLTFRGDATERPFIVWEPLPASCLAEKYDEFVAAYRLVDVFSPNHLELSALFGGTTNSDFDAVHLERCATSLVTSSIGIHESGAVIVRAGENGGFVVGRPTRPTWYPAYYAKGSEKVVDATGAGNAFLGGYIAGCQRSGGDAGEGMCYGSVAASFALEQIGLPRVERIGESVYCSGVAVSARLEEYKKRFTQIHQRLR